MSKLYMAFDVGCIECLETSAVLGIFDTEAAARAKCVEYESLGWRGGQHHYMVYQLDLQAGTGEEI